MRPWIRACFISLLSSLAAQCNQSSKCKEADASCNVLPLLLYSKVAVATNLYVVNATSGSLSEYSIDRGTGLLSSVGTATGMAGTNGVQVDPLGRFVFVAASTTPRIHRFAIDTTGALSVLGTTTPNSTFPIGLCADPTGAYLFSVVAGNGTVEGFSVSSNSVLTSTGTALAAAGG
ncbi:MAG TPA: beta-propeller fold lactonase family protein, partial [Leptospiraceae bacterium]|nr:beta-propeller fold lactonase family protein [Leptospiraceae bacterium]